MCKATIEQFGNNGFKILLEPTETPMSINAQVLDPNGIAITIVQFIEESKKTQSL